MIYDFTRDDDIDRYRARSEADLTKEEMTTAIDRYINWATQQGWRIPDPEDLRLLQSVEYEMARQKQWL